jgi:hypothetical protein
MKAQQPLKSKTTSIRFDNDLNESVHDWLDHNPGFNLSRLVNMAVRRFITKKQVLESVETIKASDKKVAKATTKMMKKHAHMLEKLK